MVTLSQPLRSKLLEWYRRVHRDLPWRRTSDPYAVWVSEIMLQQTQVATVIPYFERWMSALPTIQALAAEDEQKVLALWQGLGYYRRCRLLQAGAAHVTTHGLPQDVEGWRQVPGVGAYTAGAISSIAQRNPDALVDGNVVRVYARLAADDRVGPALEKGAWAWAKEHVDREHPGDWNQALMELGATICKPKAPLCTQCPLQSECEALRLGQVENLPRTVPKVSVKQLQNSAVIHFHRDSAGEEWVAIEQIPRGEWWEGMWRFPRSDKSGLLSAGTLTHTVTNHRIRLEIFRLDLDFKDERFRWIELKQIQSVALPSPQRKALQIALRREATLFD